MSEHPACPDCHTTDPKHHYRSGKMGRCKDCQGFKNLDIRLEAIGVDRKDNSRPYRLNNIQPCCPLCNGIKSGVLDARPTTCAARARVVD